MDIRIVFSMEHSQNVLVGNILIITQIVFEPKSAANLEPRSDRDTNTTHPAGTNASAMHPAH